MRKKIKIVLALSIAVMFIFLIYNFSKTKSVIDSDSRVQENSELTYYIDVVYDGKDSEVVTSSDTAIAKVYSDFIYVEDKIPEGLTFNRFITADDGTVGAVKRSDGTSCPGYVVGDSDGLVYDSTTNKVSFKVKHLQAGCKLTVGIVTTTPYLNGAKRKDFYNTAQARENYFSTLSNTVHVYMGKEDVTTYTVNYTYTGVVPENAPDLPITSQYADGASVGVENNAILAGYTFSGWTTEDVTVTDGKFVMPSSNVTFVGSFTKKQEYSVNYSITGEKPAGYEVPLSKTYGIGDDVVIDSLAPGDVVNGYRFLGWTNNDGIDLSEGIFEMPDSNVELVGSFEKVVYTVSYEFQGVDIPNNYQSLLPASRQYSPGETVILADNPTASGYDFLGWYYSDKFKMPEEDIVIYGEWMKKNGIFAPTITKEIVDKKDYYHKDDIVKFKITVTNNENFEITDVLLQESELEGVYFVAGEDYEVRSNVHVFIPSISAKSSVIVNAEYKAGNDILKAFSNTVELTGALADNDYYLDKSKDYKSTATFNVANINLVVNKTDNDGDSLDGAVYSLYSDSNATNLIESGLKFNLLPSTTYYLKESKAPTGYQISNAIIKIDVNDKGLVTASGYTINSDNGTNIITLTDNEIDNLLVTGGIGTYIFTFIGLFVVLATIVGYIIYKKRKDRK